MSDNQQLIIQKPSGSMLDINSYYGYSMVYTTPQGTEILIKGFIKDKLREIPNYKYMLMEVMLVNTTAGPLTDYFEEFSSEDNRSSIFIPLTENTMNVEQLTKRFEEAIESWEELSAILKEPKITTYATEGELYRWLFDGRE